MDRARAGSSADGRPTATNTTATTTSTSTSSSVDVYSCFDNVPNYSFTNYKLISKRKRPKQYKKKSVLKDDKDLNEAADVFGDQNSGNANSVSEDTILEPGYLSK